MPPVNDLFLRNVQHLTLKRTDSKDTKTQKNRQKSIIVRLPSRRSFNTGKIKLTNKCFTQKHCVKDFRKS